MIVQIMRLLVCMGVLAAIAGAGVGPHVSRAEAAQKTALVTGWVRDQRTGMGIAGARVQIGATTVLTDRAGNLPRTDVPIAEIRAEVEVVATARNYAPWRYVGVELALDHPVELRIELGDQPVNIEPQPVNGAAVPFDGPPDYINVGRTFSTSCVFPPTNVQRIDRVPFLDYVKNVLPNEWVLGWPAAALDAGAVAAGQFAWSSAFVQRKWTGRGYAFDVVDSVCDQVYKDRNPAINYASTDAAVTRMWGTALIRNNKLITTFFRDRDESCVRANSDDCMGQWGSHDRAQEGMSGLQILHYYYDPVTEIKTAPTYRALVLRQSPPNVTIWAGRTQTLSVCLRNAGTTSWQQNVTNLAVVDPNDPQNTSSTSPFADATWLNPQRPATLPQAVLSLGQSSELRFNIAAPANLAPGTYQLAVRPIQENSAAWLPGDSIALWNITVVAPTTLNVHAWLPRATGAATSTSCT